MKKAIFIWMAFCAAGPLSAQYTGIPDPNFEQALIDLGIDSDGTVDGQVLTGDVENVTVLDVSEKDISDLTGIEDFTALEDLNIRLNSLSDIDLSYNTLLKKLDCWGSFLPSLDLSNNIYLEELIARANSFSSLDLSNNTSLKLLNCSFCPLTSLDLSNNTALEYLEIRSTSLSSIDLSNNVELKVFDIRANSFTSIDISNNIYLEELYACCNSISSLDVSTNSNLKVLDIYSNTLMSALDLSNNPLLEYLDVSWIYVSSGPSGPSTLDLSNNPNLKKLVCEQTGLSSLDVSNNPLLEELWAYNTHDDLDGNNFTSLDLSNNPALKEVWVSDVFSLETINLKNRENDDFLLIDIWCYGDEGPCSQWGYHVCIEVDDAQAAETGVYPYTNWYIVGDPYHFSEDCALSTSSFETETTNLFPNPARSYLNLQTEEPLHYRLYSISGQALMSGTLPQGDNQLDVRGLSSGVYILQLDNGVGQKRMEKVVIER